MKHAIAALLLSCATLSPAAADTLWRGTAVVDDTSGTCNNYDPKGNVYTVRFAPAGIGSNGPDSRMAWFEGDGAKAFNLVKASFDRKLRKAVYTSIYAGAAESPNSWIKFNLQRPAALTDRTSFIIAQAEITNFDFMKGCTLYAKITLVKSSR